MSAIMPPLQSSGPTGATFEFEGRTYTISPSILSGKTLQTLRAHLRDLRRAEAVKLIKELGKSGHARIAIEQAIEPMAVSLPDIYRSLYWPDCLAKFLVAACGIDSLLARRITEEYPVYDELVLKAITAMGLETLKNSVPPTTESGTSQASDQNQAQPEPPADPQS